jgi:hypothetical protein
MITASARSCNAKPLGCDARCLAAHRLTSQSHELFEAVDVQLLWIGDERVPGCAGDDHLASEDLA